MDFLTVTEAIGIARELGIRLELIVRPQERRIPFSVALTSADRTPIVSVRRGTIGFRAADMYLAERDQFGPDSWDYPASVKDSVDRYFVRIGEDRRTIDIPILSASTTVLTTAEWPTRGEVRAGIARSTWASALAELGVPSGTP